MVKHALIFAGVDDLKLEKYSVDPEPGDGDVLIDMAYTGICGSDVHWLRSGSLGHFPLQPGKVYGHESSAVVKKVGPNVKNLQVGDRICMEPSVPDWSCDYCRHGRNNLCHNADNNQGRKGFFISTNCWPANICHKLPDNVSLEEAAFTEPLACAIWGVKRTRLEGGEKAVVIGCGPMGLLTIMVLKAYGVSDIVAIGLNPKRLELAESCGANISILGNRNDDEHETAKKILDKLGCAPDVFLDCCGSAVAINAGIKCVKRGGKITLVGCGPPKVNISLTEASLKEIDIITVAKFCNVFPEALRMISNGKAPVKLLISHILDLSDAQKGFDLIKAGEAVKVLFKCSDLKPLET